MADTATTDAPIEQKRSKLPLLVGLILALVGGGAGFFVMYSGLLGGAEGSQVIAPIDNDPDLPLADTGGDEVFLPIEPLIITLDQTTGVHLRFRASLEVASAAEAEVSRLMPRVVDVLNSYLRAVEVADLQDRSALARLRAQMLRRVQVVAGGGQVKDLLIMEFVLN